VGAGALELHAAIASSDTRIIPSILSLIVPFWHDDVNLSIFGFLSS
jgi:hypothetical protein